MSHKNFDFTLNNIAFGINFELGHLYYDRCGQCLKDIEESCQGWYVNNVDPKATRVENPENNLSVEFTNTRYSFTADKAFRRDIGLITKEANSIWKIIKANLGLTDFTRIGYRPSFLLPTRSAEESEKRINSADLKVTLSEFMKNAGYRLRSQHIIINFIKEPMEYRIELASLIRHEAINPNAILKGDARYLSQRQRAFLIAQQKQIAEYSHNPMFAISFDIDCFEMNPKSVNVEEFISNQCEVVSRDFLPILRDI